MKFVQDFDVQLVRSVLRRSKSGIIEELDELILEVLSFGPELLEPLFSCVDCLGFEAYGVEFGVAG